MKALWSHRRCDLAPCNNSNYTRIFLEYKGIPVLEWPGYSPDMNPIEDVVSIIKKEIGNVKQCKKKIFGSEYVKRMYSVTSNVLEELLQFNAKENYRSY